MAAAAAAIAMALGATRWPRVMRLTDPPLLTKRFKLHLVSEGERTSEMMMTLKSWLYYCSIRSLV